MSRYLNNLKTLPELPIAQIKAILKLPNELRFMGFVESVKALNSGREIRNLYWYASKADYRDFAEKQPKLTKEEKLAGKKITPINFISFDENNDDNYSFSETIAATDPAEILECITSMRSRHVELDQQSEAVLEILHEGTLIKSKKSGLSQRREQQIIKANIEKIAEEQQFRKGGKGQGGLFSFDSGVSHA